MEKTNIMYVYSSKCESNPLHLTALLPICCAPAQQPFKIIILSNKILFCLIKCLTFKRDKLSYWKEDFSLATDLLKLTFLINLASYIGSMKSLPLSYWSEWILTRKIDLWVFMVLMLTVVYPSFACSLEY